VKSALKKALLYGICDLGYLTAEQALPVSRKLLLGGAGILQLRAKGHDPADLLPLAKDLKALCDEFKVPFVVNDHLKLAQESLAHGLHLGQDDGSLSEARSQLGPDLILGRSTHSLAQAKAALAEGADYIGFGPLFPTPTKKGRPGIGMADLAEMQASVGSQIPAFCIGGIKPDNLNKVLAAGAQRIVIVSHLLTASDVQSSTTAIHQHLLNQATL
jgi:thiamine-phosphate pyrophosphorylase